MVDVWLPVGVVSAGDDEAGPGERITDGGSGPRFMLAGAGGTEVEQLHEAAPGAVGRSQITTSVPVELPLSSSSDRSVSISPRAHSTRSDYARQGEGCRSTGSSRIPRTGRRGSTVPTRRASRPASRTAIRDLIRSAPSVPRRPDCQVLTLKTWM
jgi:hypothetical protein